jgi:hypothetical protein
MHARVMAAMRRMVPVAQEQGQFRVLGGQHGDSPAGDLPASAQDQYFRHPLALLPWLTSWCSRAEGGFAAFRGRG